MKFLIFTFICLFGGVTSERVTYNEYSVYEVIPKTEKQLLGLKILEEDLSGYDFWKGPTKPYNPVHIMVPPHLRENFNETLNSLEIEGNIYINNVQTLIDNERRKSRADGDYGWEDYYTLEEIYAWLENVAETYPDNVKLVKGGESYEGRDILGLHISYSTENSNRVVFIEGGIHAREWISPATVTYLINEILTSTSGTLRTIAEEYDWYFFPVFNPDGYEFTFNSDRLWRKTRVPYGLCHGADPNRNWGYMWNSGGASDLPCTATYAGPNAFSEPSQKSISEFISSIGENLYAYISFHSYSQLLLIPYGHTAEHLENYDELMAIGTKAIESLAQRYGTQYTVGNTAETIYVASGTSVDWVKGSFGTRITYTYELRDTGNYGFVLPPDQITDNCLEVLDSIITIFLEAKATES